ncbi:hypothetical protein NL676_000816 [Syzygium grande]|nr:hypothetical protein NL676_000816 [Syzygium grande]
MATGWGSPSPFPPFGDRRRGGGRAGWAAPAGAKVPRQNHRPPSTASAARFLQGNSASFRSVPHGAVRPRAPCPCLLLGCFLVIDRTLFIVYPLAEARQRSNDYFLEIWTSKHYFNQQQLQIAEIAFKSAGLRHENGGHYSIAL